MEAKLTLPTNKAKWEELREFISNKIKQFEEQHVLVKTEANEMHFNHVGVPNVLQRRVGRVEMMPLLERLVTYSMMLKVLMQPFTDAQQTNCGTQTNCLWSNESRTQKLLRSFGKAP
jgi:hypothetical protein